MPEGGSLLELRWGPSGRGGAGAAGVAGRLAALQEALRLDGLQYKTNGLGSRPIPGSGSCRAACVRTDVQTQMGEVLERACPLPGA